MNIIDSFLDSFSKNPDHYKVTNPDLTNSDTLAKHVLISHKIKKFVISQVITKSPQIKKYTIRINDQHTFSSERSTLTKEDISKLGLIFELIPRYDALAKVKNMSIDDLDDCVPTSITELETKKG